MFKQEATIARDLNLPAEFTTKLPNNFLVSAAVSFKEQAKMDPQAYITGLAKNVHGNNSYVFESSKVTSFCENSRGCSITANGVTLTAKAMVVATNVPAFPLLARGSYCFWEYPQDTYGIAVETKQPFTGMYISPDENQFSSMSWRKDKRDYIIVVGEGHIPGILKNPDKHHQTLIAYAHKNFDVVRVSHSWLARDYIAYDNVPLAGKLYPWSRNMYVVTAFKKWGLTNATVAAGIVSDLILCKDNLYRELYDSLRLRPVKKMPVALFRQLAS